MLRVTAPAPVWVSLTAVRAVPVMALVITGPARPAMFSVFMDVADRSVMVAALPAVVEAPLVIVSVSISFTVTAVVVAALIGMKFSASAVPEPVASVRVTVVVAAAAPKVTSAAAALEMVLAQRLATPLM